MPFVAKATKFLAKKFEFVEITAFTGSLFDNESEKSSELQLFQL